MEFFKNDTQPDSQKIKSAKDAEFLIGDNLLKWLCFSRVGMVTCCQKTRQHASKEESHIHDPMEDVKPFRFCVYSNDRSSASELWETCENPMLTALISSCYLKAMAKVAEKWFEDSLQRNLEDHAKLFANRAVQLLDKLFQHDEEMATNALDHASVVWEYIESPLHFGHQFGMEDFISHTSTQKDANKRLYSYINNRSSYYIVNEKNENDIENNSPQPECPDFIKHHHKQSQWYKYLTAPVSRMLINVALYITVLVMFVIFLTTDMHYNSISVLEWVVSIWIIGDFFEECFISATDGFIVLPGHSDDFDISCWYSLSCKHLSKSRCQTISKWNSELANLDNSQDTVLAGLRRAVLRFTRRSVN
ncbi:uncharacterized protein LOC134684291 [Mytilus trossulus]|uniref:uncharacterized protein LOC134684291 n=1 Tax=Mytilus trossulus TaxID=6551 RepID=UPI003006F9D1